jgi:hypothetical protein
MKLRAPVGCCAASYAGRVIEIAEDGSVEVEDNFEVVFFTHGFKPWESPDSTPFPTGKRCGEFAARAMDIAMETVPVTDPNCTSVAPVEAPMPADGCVDTGTSTSTSDMGVDDISALSRRALFAFLREKGISVSLPITNEELRAAARRSGAALSGQQKPGA